MNHKAVFHPAEDFLEQFGGDKEVSLEIIAIARNDMESRLQELLADGKRGDCPAFARHLHAMRGVVATFGCESLAAFLQTTENNVEEQQNIGTETLSAIEAAAAAFLKSLDEFETAIRLAD